MEQDCDHKHSSNSKIQQNDWEKKKEKNQIVAVIQSESRPQPGLNTVVGFYSHKPQWPKQV